MSPPRPQQNCPLWDNERFVEFDIWKEKKKKEENHNQQKAHIDRDMGEWLQLHRGVEGLDIARAKLPLHVASKRVHMPCLHDHRRVVTAHRHGHHSVTRQGSHWSWNVPPLYLRL